MVVRKTTLAKLAKDVKNVNVKMVFVMGKLALATAKALIMVQNVSTYANVKMGHVIKMMDHVAVT